MFYFLELILKFIICFVVSAVIGYNRGQKNQAGVRTHILVGIGSLLSIVIALRVQELGMNNNADVLRMSAQVISGIGFLGAGSIIKNGNYIKGLTTAASLWTVALICIAFGAGLYVVGFIAFFLSFITLKYLDKIKFLSTSKFKRFILEIEIEYTEENEKKFRGKFNEIGVKDNFIHIVKYNIKDGKSIALFNVDIRYRHCPLSINQVFKILSEFEFIDSVDITDDERIYSF